MAVDSVQSRNSAGNVAGDHLGPDGFDYNRIAGVSGNRHVTPEFIRGVEAMAGRLGTQPEYLLAVMSFETGGSFSPGIRNGAGSGATGLIQFMPATARELGTSTEALARMSATEQLEYVERYFARRSDPGDLNTLEGGTHMTGFRKALTSTINKYAERNALKKKLKENISGDDLKDLDAQTSSEAATQAWVEDELAPYVSPSVSA